MIEKFRHASESWIMRGFFLIITLVFIFMWGGGDFVGRLANGGDKTVITIGSHKITMREFYEILGRQMQMIELRTGQAVDEQKARQMGLYDYVRENIINETLINLEAKRMGVYVSDKYIRDHIKQEKAFQDSSGNFDKIKFNQIINKLGFNEMTYIEQIRAELTRVRLVDALTSGIKVPQTLWQPVQQWQLQQRQISSVRINSTDFKISAKPTLEQLTAYFNEHKEKFKTQEYRDLTAVIMDADVFLDKVPTPTDLEIEAAYQARQDNFKGKELKEVKAQILTDLKNQQAADMLQQSESAIEDDVMGGSTLEDVAKKYNFELKQFKHYDAQGQYDPFSKEVDPQNAEPLREIDRVILKEAYNIDGESASQILDAGQGRRYIVRVDSIHPSRARSFEEVQAKLDVYWLYAEQIRKAEEQVQLLMADMNNKTPFDSAVGKYKLKALSTRINRDGVVGPSSVPLSREIVGTLFTLAKNKAQAFVTLDNGERKEILVTVVSRIDYKNKGSDAEENQKFQEILKQNIANDIINDYVFSLRKRYPVEMNRKFFAQNKS